MPNSGRRFTIEPRPQRPNSAYPPRPVSQPVVPAKRPSEHHTGNESSSKSISGIRLFPGNSLIISRKYGTLRNQLIADLENQSLTFTVTERGLEPEAFVRVIYRCPRGVFVQTVRGDEEEGSAKQPTSLHKVYEFDRDAGQALVIRPRVPSEAAALDIENQGLFIQHWFDAERGNVCLRVAATDAWEVVRAEQLRSQPAAGTMSAALDESSKEFLAAFIKASEHYLDREEFDLLRQQAWKIVNSSKMN